MKMAVISSGAIISKGQLLYAYGPYVRELDIWARHADKIAFMCPIWKHDKNILISEISFPVSKIFEAREFNVKDAINLVRAFLFSFNNFYNLFRAMLWADHIHLRCPGNIGLMGCFVQMFFPHKPKTAKYAGNWDPDSQQPLSYRLQKWILDNTFLTRNMQVLVYGKWEGSSKNIKPFFTATYTESDKVEISPRALSGKITFLFVGTLSAGKRPLYAIGLVQKLKKLGFDVVLECFGEGKERPNLEAYRKANNLEGIVKLHGNQSKEVVCMAYKRSHFLLLPSESEGWPKVVAEAMFWGCFPVASPVSCVPFMLDQGNRGLLLSMDADKDTSHLAEIIRNPEQYAEQVLKSISWSRQYTIDLFEDSIKALLQK